MSDPETFVEQYNLTVDEVATARGSCVLIDDSGTPDPPASTTHLHPDRKTWVAVLLTPGHFSEVVDQMPGACEELANVVGTREFHFTDIYGGTAAFRDVPLSLRLTLFDFMRSI